MPKHSRATKSKSATSRGGDSIAEAREVLIQFRERLMSQVHQLDRTLENLDSLAASSRVDPKKSLQELFNARDQSRPGSKEEELAAERILELVFPDTNAG